MKHQSSQTDLGVFDFKEDVESVPVKWTPKFVKPKLDSSPVSKYQFLECFARGSDFQLTKTDESKCVDVDDDNHCPVDNAKCTPLGIVLEDQRIDGINSTALPIPLEDSTSTRLRGFKTILETVVEQPCYFNDETLQPKSTSTVTEKRVINPGVLSPEHGNISSTVAESPFSNGSVGVASSDADRMEESSPSTPASLLAENNVSAYGQSHSLSFSGLELEEADTTVVLHADYVACHDNYYPSSWVCFSNTSFKIQVLFMHQEVETCRFEWEIDDIHNIESQWNSRTKIAMVRLRVLTKDEAGIAGIEQLKFAVCDHDWSRKQDRIMSLDVRYKALWNIVSDIDKTNGDKVPGENSLFYVGPYFPNFEEPFEDVVYPEGDVDAVSISKGDVDLLKPETFINDTIIDFYIKYLKNKIPPEEKQRFHFFNSFFFRKLADLDKNPLSAFDGMAAFQRVRKWTRKFDLFAKDYIFIPVNYNLHWSLIVICHPGEVANSEDKNPCESSRVPCILHMDSIRGSHTGLKNLVQSYLWEEWKERRKETYEDFSAKVLNLRFVSLELPQQENCYDCGLFLLHYVELFVAGAPANFNPFRIKKYSNFLNVDWFMPAEVSLKRAHIQRLIFELLENRCRESAPTSCGDELPSSKLMETNGDDTGVEFVSESSSPGKICGGNSIYCHPVQGIELSMLGAASFRSSPCASEGSVLRELFEPGTSAGSIFGHYQHYDLGASYGQPGGAMSPIEEEDEVLEHRVYSPSSLAGLQLLDGLTSERSSIAYTSRVLGAGILWNPGISDHAEDDDDYSSPVTNDNSDNSEIEVVENDLEAAVVSSSQNENFDQARCPLREKAESLSETFASASSEMLETQAEDFQELLKVQSNIDEGNPPSVREDECLSSHEEPGVGEKRGAADDYEQLFADDSSSDPDEQKSTKRVRLSHSDDEGNQHGGSPPREPQL
ncbi:hypothetical protein Nepgr_019237 [Nepenthes gracilis]|uniref:Ubiquitin-like protease family profile domain-containing protein n=1 Tax=Nepenthes gracilis TaxID=150966 RepID=A0AAD3SUW2_NEPGR|nr:hypothetical protein Nepgr_019237 [Nepenthes gracilis]